MNETTKNIVKLVPLVIAIGIGIVNNMYDPMDFGKNLNLGVSFIIMGIGTLITMGLYLMQDDRPELGWN